MKRAEQLFALVLLAFSSFIWWQSTRIESGAEFGMGPAFMPTWLSVGLALISLGMLYRTATAPANGFAAGFWYDRPGAFRVIGMFACYLLAILIMKPLGIMFSIALIMAASLLILGCKDWKTVVLAALLAAIGIYLVFGRWLQVDLPMGVLEELLPIY